MIIYLQTPLGGIHLSETKSKFLEGNLHPANVLMCPHTCVTNLPKPREVHPGNLVMPPDLFGVRHTRQSPTNHDQGTDPC